MTHTCITVEGGLLAPDFLEMLQGERGHEIEGQKASDFGVDGRRTLVDEVSSLWSDVRSYWDAFQRRLQRSSSESLTTVTREQWVIPLLDALGYTLTYQPSAAEVDGRTYRISHRAGDDPETPPIHVEQFDQELGSRPPSGRGNMSPHALVQDYLNRTEHLWGIVTNGSILRLLRDSSYFTRPSYIEFDLRQMLEGERLDEFFIFYRLVHRTRLPRTTQDADQCLLERYHQLGVEQGGRIRDGLRDAVEQAIRILGNGFLNHPQNRELHEAVRSGTLTPAGFYQQLLYLIYRFLFLMVAEERNLLTVGDEDSPAREYFTIRRLRNLADEPLSAPERFDDLYLNLRALFLSLCDERFAAMLGLPPLNGELFDCARTSDLGNAYLDNRDLLDAVGTLSWFISPGEKIATRVNYGALDVEELGSVYESLLDFQPILTTEPTLAFTLGIGTERKTTGSYYTRPELVLELIKSALEPVIADRLAAVSPSPERSSAKETGQGGEAALLALRVCDPACGSGHFLLAAARRIGTELAKVRTGEEAPAPDAVRTAVRDAITHCIYGVDKNPLAVDLCKVALWIEGHSGGKPLTFLDHRIRCGDSLVGVFDLSVLQDGIPDAAFDAVSGDEKPVAKAIKAKNKQERAGQRGFTYDAHEEIGDLLAERQELDSLHDDTADEVHRKRDAFERLQRKGGTLWRERMACNLWTAAFFADLTEEAQGKRRIPTTEDLRRFMENPNAVDGRVIGYVQAVALHDRFFHWHLEFPEVFEAGGFDCVLSNPPWEMIELQEQQFFAARAPEIADAPNKAARERLIRDLASSNPSLHRAFRAEVHLADAESRFLREGDRFPLTARGRINTFAVFAELSRRLLAGVGRAGVVLPTGIATDDNTKGFFSDLVSSGSLAHLIGFENEALIFPSVHHGFKFCALTLTGGGVRIPAADFVFACRHFHQVSDPRRHFVLTDDDIALINPNTRTCPIFRTAADAQLTRAVYRRVPAFVDDPNSRNPWEVRFRQGFLNTAGDSHLFRTRPECNDSALHLQGTRFVKETDVWVPVCEAKMLWQYDHRYGTFDERQEARGFTALPQVLHSMAADDRNLAMPYYWVPLPSIMEQRQDHSTDWLLVYRRITNATNERSMIATVIPLIGANDSTPVVTPGPAVGTATSTCLLANFNAAVLDYAVRQRIGGLHLDFHHLKQLPILPPNTYTATHLLFIAPRVVELVYTAWDIKAFADDVWREGDDALRQALQQQWEANRSETGGHTWDPPEWAEIVEDGCPLPPFKWSDDRRAILRAELDAYYARLYGLNRKQLRYILDPHGLSERELADILDPWEDPTCTGPHLLPSEPAIDFPSETFRVLKNKEEKAFGEYRTRRLVLEAWERQNGDTCKE